MGHSHQNMVPMALLSLWFICGALERGAPSLPLHSLVISEESPMMKVPALGHRPSVAGEGHRLSRGRPMIPMRGSSVQEQGALPIIRRL